MVKFLATGPGGRRILGLGLVRGNLTRLTDGQPIHINAEQMGLAHIDVQEVFIFFGETEETIAHTFKVMGFVDENTPIRTDKRDVQ